MGEKPYNMQEIQGPIKLVCHHCGAENPAKAYCCITCFKVLRPKAEKNLWQMAMKPSVSITILFSLLVIFGLLMMKNWVDKIEGRVQMDLKTADYNISVVADKQKKSNPYDEIDPNPVPEAAAPAAPAPAAPSEGTAN